MKKCASCTKDLPDAALHCVFCGAKQRRPEPARVPPIGLPWRPVLRDMDGQGAFLGLSTAEQVPQPTQVPASKAPLSQRRARDVPERFLVALSFSGAEREFVRAIAEAVEDRLGPSSVFFDEWYEFYIGGHDADVKLQHIYSAGCELAVVCVSATYGSKAWTKAEHEAIRSRLMQARVVEDPRQRDRVFPIRVGDGNVDGIPFNALVPDVRGRPPERVAELIADRLQFAMGSAERAEREMPSGRHLGSENGGRAAQAARPRAHKVTSPTPAYLSAEVQALGEQLERARARKQSLRDTGIATDEVDREILELRRKLRDGGQLRAGDSLGDGRYLLVKPVGRGGFAVVWEAFDRTEQRRVAIKVLHQHLASDPHRRERFFRGARVMMKLKHPAVVRVLDPKGEDDGFCYFVMELVPSGNLREAVLENRVEAECRLALIIQVGEALAEAHRKQLVHRDIKPANILIDEDGSAKLTDFDLVGAHDTTGGTRTGAMGTVVYAAPECLDRPQDATARADVFGLGMTAIFCLSGHDLTMDTLRDTAGALAQLDCTIVVRKVLERAVDWKPDRRFADAAEMVDALRVAREAAAPEQQRLKYEMQLRRAEIAKRRWLLVFPSAALLLTTGVVIFAVQRKRESDAVKAALAESEKLQAEIEKLQAQETLRYLTDHINEEDKRLKAAEAVVGRALNPQAHSVAEANLAESKTNLDRLRKQRIEVEQRLAAAAAKAERVNGMHPSQECLDNPLAKGCS